MDGLLPPARRGQSSRQHRGYATKHREDGPRPAQNKRPRPSPVGRTVSGRPTDVVGVAETVGTSGNVVFILRWPNKRPALRSSNQPTDEIIPYATKPMIDPSESEHNDRSWRG